jgi:hypothetical protein
MVMAVSAIHLTTFSCTALDTKLHGGICNEKIVQDTRNKANGE